MMEEGRRKYREMSGERGRTCVQTRVMKPSFKKVQVVYYLSSNGHLQHPHYLEITHLSHQQLRLKDVLDRLTVLRGKGMPSLYSWSCKRSYKNGYVWNDLAQNDVIFPSLGGEYVLKGSELVANCTGSEYVLEGFELVADCTEKLQQLQLGHAPPFHDEGGRSSGFYPENRVSPSKQPIDGGETVNEVEEEEEFEEKAMHTTCSRGVSTEEIGEEEMKRQKQKQSSHTELNLDSNSLSSPPSTASSTVSDNNPADQTTVPKRFEDGDPIGSEPMLSRNSMLFSLIACGGSASFRKAALPPSVGRKSCSGGSLHKGVVCKAAAAGAKTAAEDEDRVMIKYMSENPRFGNSQAEEKEYFSGSIAEQIVNDHDRINSDHATLKKSSSYNEERSAKVGLGDEEDEEEEEVKKERGLRGKCIPRKKKSSSKEGKK